MDKNPLVSIIVPVYGTEAYLPACIDSIRNQSYQNLQIILVDDQSPDRCPEICDSYAQEDPRIQVIHQNNTGVSGARNTGLQQVAGEYTLFVDSDDELYSDSVEVLVKDALNYSADIVSGSARVIDESGKLLKNCDDGTCFVYNDEKPLVLSLRGGKATSSVCTKLFKSEFLKGIRFDEGKNINEDGFFLFQCYLKQPVLVQHNVTVYQYNIRRGSCSRQIFSEKYLSMLFFCEKKRELIQLHYPQFLGLVHNMEVRTNLQLLDLLCSTTDTKYRELQRQCVRTVRRLNKYHEPINKHHRQLAWIVTHGLYPAYKFVVRVKHYR